MTGVLPMVEFLNGHSFFVTQLHKKYNTKPVALHATYQFGDTPEYSYGKRERLRQAGIWWVENDQFYAGNYLVINGDMMEGFNASDVALHAWEPVEPSAFATSRDPTGTGDGGVSLHLQADALQRRRLQDAFALAHLLGRTLVLPTLKCHCDRYWWLLHGCRTPGAERMPLPYECPMDHVFEPSMWFKANLHFRQAGFLQSSRLPKAVLNSRAKLPQNLCKCQSEAANEEKLAQCEHEYWGTLRADDTLEYAPGEGKVATHGQAVHKDAYHLHPMTMPESAAASPEDAKLKQARILEVDVKALDTFCWSGNAQFDRSMRAALDMHTGFCPRELNKIPPNWKPETHPLNCSWGYTVPTPLGVVSKERRENMKQT
ncbi:hypothetical protein CYMTET_23785 [Cymbomonas tetramitiformis]|uniref:Uncharacterized protein n=1 Tax=Cymbomonas tetramitiformis TaxID=36881 RepID=A0AAE0FXN0_9CHLO|nr:hypothetical protein CYMTET_23785 [Cymbomonas tetramitiformis]